MNHLVGSKGQIIIEKEIRDRLGLEPGWRAVQVLEGDHVKLYFLPPEHNESLGAFLSRYISASLPTTQALNKAREAAWGEASTREPE